MEYDEENFDWDKYFRTPRTRVSHLVDPDWIDSPQVVKEEIEDLVVTASDVACLSRIGELKNLHILEVEECTNDNSIAHLDLPESLLHLEVDNSPSAYPLLRGASGLNIFLSDANEDQFSMMPVSAGHVHFDSEDAVKSTRMFPPGARWNALTVKGIHGFNFSPEWKGSVNHITLRGCLRTRGLVEHTLRNPAETVVIDGGSLVLGESRVWDICAGETFIDFTGAPPKWLMETWGERPSGWSEKLEVPHVLAKRG